MYALQAMYDTGLDTLISRQTLIDRTWEPMIRREVVYKAIHDEGFGVEEICGMLAAAVERLAVLALEGQRVYSHICPECEGK